MKNQIHEKIVNILAKHADCNIKILTTDEDINEINEKLFSIESLYSGHDTKIITEKNTLIVFDTNDYNSAFMHEYLDSLLNNRKDISIVFNAEKSSKLVPKEALEKFIVDSQEKFNKIFTDGIDIVYCNNLSIQEKLFDQFFKKLKINQFTQNSELDMTPGDIQQKIDEINNQSFVSVPTLMMINPKASEILLDWERFGPFDNMKFFSAIMSIANAQDIVERKSKENVTN